MRFLPGMLPLRASALLLSASLLLASLALAGPNGREIAERKGCLNCHSTDGSRKAGPSFQGIFGREVTVVRGDDKVTLESDEEYLRRAIENPAAEIVEGYSPAMPVFRLSEQEMNALLDYLKEL